ncbi:MAG TPA: hypothetical protein VME21_09170 [Steroidobacteraceae bacterium]|nr:hypothetical protein [Steroidobacteraceae bacterium]
METPANTQVTDALHQVIAETEAILAALDEDDGDGRLRALCQRVQETVDSARARLAEIERAPERPLERAVSALQSWVQDHPWTTIAVCLGAGVLAGAWVGRRLRSAAGRVARGPDAS